jgi:anti-sigma factor RsiW
MVDETESSDLRAAIKSRTTRYAAPPDLRQRIHAAVAQSAVSAVPSRTTRGQLFGWRWLQMGATLACAVLASVLATQMYFAPTDTVRVNDEIIAAHVRSLMVAHLEDVASSDQHTVKPWFAGKLDFSPPVNDFSSQGFPLIGGRLDYIDKHFAAALVYRRHGHVINVFVWPIRETDRARALNENKEGFNLIAWSRSELQYWLVSDVNSEELQQFSKLLRDAGVQGNAQ